MWVMRKTIPAVAAASATAFLALGATASAQFTELGKLDTGIKPRCPAAPCSAVSRTTGFLARNGDTTTPMAATRSGRIVAWTVSLGRPTSKQIKWFDSKLGGASKAQVTVLQRSSDRKKKTTYRVIKQGEPVKLEPYFGRTRTFALHRSIAIKKGQVIGLTVPTWAPSLATSLADNYSWRASRTRAQCADYQLQTAQIKGTAEYACLYKNERITYSVWIVPTPVKR